PGGARWAWPVVALVTANPQPEYGAAARHDRVHETIRGFLATRPLAVSEVDTRVDPALTDQRASGQVAGRLAAADVVVTTRLHGLVIGLRHGTPVLALDPIAGGAKVAAQAAALGWPAVIVPERLDTPALEQWLDFCLSPAAASAVARSRRRGASGLTTVEGRLLSALEVGSAESA
ncbi:MAG: polysaccharide pyruvyl transferase family protein, partial [Acidimicrobiaceae bacterium]|nr:polysaccharide pyruvyl transferase family protein [Acidimicrobiaceae bacterium]